MKFDKEKLDSEILEAIKERGYGPTYYIRNCIDWPGRPFHKSGIKTSHVLTACRRLEREGKIKEVPTPYAIMKCWASVD